jgi:hypothetical protein
MKRKSFLILALACATPLFAQTLTNVSMTVVPPVAAPIIHKIVIANALAQLDPQAPAGKRAFVAPAQVAADGSLTLTIIYR